MRKYFCDLCGGPAGDGLGRVELTMPDKVLADKSAKVRLVLSIGYEKHSTGYGGPPDICAPCVMKCIAKLRDSPMLAAQRKGKKRG